MKKILIVTDFFDPHYSGIVTCINQVILKLINQNYRVIVLTGKLNIYERKITRINKSLIVIRSEKTFNFSRGFYSLSMIKDFFLISKKVEAINLHFPISEIFPIIFLTRKPIILNYHCNPPLKFNLFDIIIYFYFYLFGIIAFIKSKLIFIFSKDYFNSFICYKLFNYKTCELRPYVNSFLIKDNLNNYVLNINEKPIFGFLGRISEEKGLIGLIKASSILNNENFSHQLIIAGNFNDPRFKKYIHEVKLHSNNNNSVLLIESINEDEKINFYDNIHILVLPSINSFEAFGLVQLEAMSAGKLIVSSNLKGVRTPVINTNNGQLINNEKNPEDIAKALKAACKLAKIKTKNEVINNFNKCYNKQNFEKDLNFIFSKNIF